MADLSIAGPTFLPDKHCVSGGITTLFLGPTFLPRQAKYIADALRAFSRRTYQPGLWKSVFLLQ